MDGYIKNKVAAIKSVRKEIFWKYSITFLIVIFIPVWLFGLAVNQPPEKWTDTEIVFSHISSEERLLRPRFSIHRHVNVLNTQDGRQFVIKSKYVDVDDLSNNLVPGNAYYLVFSNTIAGRDQMEALSDDETVFLNLENSVALWESEQQEALIAIIVTLVIEIVALLLIDRFGCRKEHAKIKKLKEDIKRRKNRINNK